MSHPSKTLSATQLRLPETGIWPRLPLIAAVVGVLAIGASFLLGGGEPARFYFSYLVAFLFVLSIALGALFFVLFHFATKAGWGIVVRRVVEGTAATLPILFLLFLPVFFGLHDLYHWSHADALEHDPILAGKSPYLNSGFFLLRAVAYFVIWSGLAIWYLRTSRRQDTDHDERLTRRMIAMSYPGLALFALTVTYASFDWIMSLDPHWFSTMYGVYFFSGCLVGQFAFLVLITTALERAGTLRDAVTDEHFHDLGKLLFAFTVFWTYIAFSQYFLIWYANIPEETKWYMVRSQGSWELATRVLAVGHFFLPFFFLMPRTVKRKRAFLAIGATWMLVMHYFDLYWQVMPILDTGGVHFTVVDVAALVGMCGLFLAATLFVLRQGTAVPVGDPRILESLSFENA